MKSKTSFRCSVYLILVALFCPASFLRAQTPDNQPAHSDQSWTATTESSVPSGSNPIRTTETHKEAGNRTVDTQSVQRLGPEGRFEPYYDVEKESVRVNATTTKTITRTFARDASGQKSLTQVTEEEKESLPEGSEKVVRTTKNPDLEGHLSIVEREVSDTKKTGPDSQEAKTTVFQPDVNGSLAPSVQTIERKTRSEHTTDVQKSTLLLDGSGNWQVHELKQSTIKEAGKDRTTEERVSYPGLDGKLSLSSSTTSKESETDTGERHNLVETYSTYVPGATTDGSLHLSQRVTTVRRTHPDGSQSSVQQVQQPNPDSPSTSLQVIQVVSTDESGKQQTRTIQAPDGGGDLQVVSVEIKKSDQPQPAQVPPAPQEKPK
jgi:hypothetical protein